MTSPVLSVKDLRVNFPSEAGSVSAVRGVDFDLSCRAAPPLCSPPRGCSTSLPQP